MTCPKKIASMSGKPTMTLSYIGSQEAKVRENEEKSNHQGVRQRRSTPLPRKWREKMVIPSFPRSVLKAQAKKHKRKRRVYTQ